jgi:hypothetical protein
MAVFKKITAVENAEGELAKLKQQQTRLVAQEAAQSRCRQ